MREFYFAERGLAYRTNEFRPERRTLLFLHGLSGSISAWYPYEPAFESAYNVITVDLRGHGLSKRWPRPEDYRVEGYANDIEALLKYLAVERVTIVAHSFGTLVALILVRNAPHLCSDVVLLSPNFNLYPLWRTKLALPFVRLAVFLLSFLPHRSHYGRVDYDPIRGGGDFDPRRIVRDVYRTGLHSYFATLLHIDGFQSTDWGAFSMPTLVVHGAHDQMVPVERAKELAATLPHAKLLILDPGTHMLVNNYITEVTNVLLDFLRTSG